VQIEGELEKVGATTDDITLQLLKNGTLLTSQSLTGGQTGTISLSEEVEVLPEDRIVLHIKIDSPIDLAQLGWTQLPNLFYSASPALDELFDEDGNPLVQLDLFASSSLYPESNLSAPLQPWTATETGTYTVTSLLVTSTSYTGTTTVMMTVKRRGELVSKHPIQITNGVVNNDSFTIQASQNEELFFEFSTIEPKLAAHLSQVAAEVTDLSSTVYSVPTELHTASEPSLVAPAYRGWNVFGYDGNRERAEQPIQITEDDLKGTALQVAADDLTQKAQDATLNSIEDESMAQMPQMKVLPYYPNPAQQRWLGPDDYAWVAADSMSSSRKGLDAFDVPEPQAFAGARGVARLSKSNQFSVMLGAGFLSGSLGRSKSYGLLDMFDMNGDRFPDIVSQSGVQYTDMLGGLEASRRAVFGGKIRRSSSDSFNFGVGGNYPLVRHTSGGNAGPASNQMASLGLSGNLTQSDSESDYDFMDVNGDGLPDKVHQSGGTLMVALNVGYGFLPAEAWGSATINESDSQGFSLGGSIGFNDGIYGFGGGLNVSRSESETDKWLASLNGDGLLDRVSGSGVSYNTGNGFVGGSSNLGDTMTNSDTTAGGGVYFTINIPLSVPPLPPLSLVINPGADVNRSVSRQEVSFSDINGDGYPDYLHSTEDSSMSVGLSQIGRTNMLKGVERPLGATIELDYERSGNTYDQPHNQWVMSRLEVNDGHVGDGVDVQVMSYQYEDGFYHRQERDFYGYETVVTEQRDYTNADALYRTVTQVYHNDSYYNKGLLEREFTADAEGNLYLETENTYLLRDIERGNELANPQDLTATVFPELRRTDKRFYEGEATAGKSTYTTFAYDALGNVTGFVDAADVGADDDVAAEIGYHSDEANYIMGKASSIRVYGNGTLMRRREADFETATGNLLEVREYLASGDGVITNIEYDIYGNISALTGPLNHKGQRYALDYTYDEELHTYNTSVLDTFGYISTATYNLFYGQTLVSTDINQNSIEYTYDNFGRTKTIVAPYQRGTELYTIHFEYHPDDEEPWALSKHIDVHRDVNDPIETVLFTDGLKRVILTKKDSTLHTSPTRPANESSNADHKAKPPTSTNSSSSATAKSAPNTSTPEVPASSPNS
jgi:hypothetical protein